MSNFGELRSWIHGGKPSFLRTLGAIAIVSDVALENPGDLEVCKHYFKEHVPFKSIHTPFKKELGFKGFPILDEMPSLSSSGFKISIFRSRQAVRRRVVNKTLLYSSILEMGFAIRSFTGYYVFNRDDFQGDVVYGQHLFKGARMHMLGYVTINGYRVSLPEMSRLPFAHGYGCDFSRGFALQKERSYLYYRPGESEAFIDFMSERGYV